MTTLAVQEPFAPINQNDNSFQLPPGFAIVPIESLRSNPPSIDASMKLGEFVEKHFLPEKKTLSHLTLRGYLGDIRRCILPVLGTVPIGSINHSRIQAMIDSCPTRKAALSAKCTLSSILGCAVSLDMLDVNPALGRYRFPRQIEPNEPPLGVWLTDFSQIAAVLRLAQEYDDGGEIERACLLGYGFGLRKGEILGVDAQDMDLKNGVLHVRRAFTRWNGKAEVHALKTVESSRDIPFLGYVLDRCRELKPEDGAFVNCGGRRSNPSTLAKRFNAFALQMGLPHITLFTMRHSFATSALRAGIAVKDVQVWLGHTSPTTTMRYMRPNLATLRNDACLMSAILERALEGMPLSEPNPSPVPELRLREVMGEDLRSFSPSTATLTGTRRETVILEMLRANPKATQAEVADAIGVSYDLVRLMFANLKQRGLLDREGGNRGGVWIVKAS